MKPHILVNADIDQQFSKHFSHEMLNEEQTDSFFKKMLSSLIAVTLVFSIYAISPKIIEMLKGANEQAAIVQPIVQEPEATAYTDAYIWTAKLKLEDFKLNHRLQIIENGHDQLQIFGDISTQEIPNWKNFVSWYESKEGFPKLDHKVSFGATTGNIPVLRSVWFDAKPTAYFADGSSGSLGTVLENGWKIVGIEAWAIFVERNGTTIILSY